MRCKNSSWYLIIFFFSLALFAWLEASYTFIDPDSFYHARIGQLISQYGIIQDFPWQQTSILKDNFADQHLLYHLLIAPLNYFFTPAIAVKIGSVILNAIFVMLFVWYLHRKKIKYYWAYGFLLLITVPFLIRLSAPKASPLALILLLLGIYCLEQKKYLFLFLLSFLYVWSHGGFILLLIVGLLFSWRSLLAIMSGFAAGLIINPYFPKNIIFYWQQVVQIGIINYRDKFEVGAEWYRYYLQDLVGSSYIIWIPLVLAVVVFFMHYKKLELNYKQWGILLIFFFLATLRSRRFVEYFIPVTIIWSALILNWFTQSAFFIQLRQSFSLSWHRKKFWWALFFIYLLLALPLGIMRGLFAVKAEQEQGISIAAFSSASTYLSEHSMRGSIVFNGRWDEWPELFFHNQHNYYLVGLDPTFMYKYNVLLFNLWQDISNGKVKDDLSRIIVQNFRSRYVFINNNNEETKLFHAYLARDKKIKLIYHDDEASIYELAL